MSATETGLAAVFGPLASRALDAADNALIDNQPALVDVLRKYETLGVDALAADLEAAIPTQSLGEKISHGEVVATISNFASEIVAQLPNDDTALLNVVESWLADLSAKAAGSS